MAAPDRRIEQGKDELRCSFPLCMNKATKQLLFKQNRDQGTFFLSQVYCNGDAAVSRYDTAGVSFIMELDL